MDQFARPSRLSRLPRRQTGRSVLALLQVAGASSFGRDANGNWSTSFFGSFYGANFRGARAMGPLYKESFDTGMGVCVSLLTSATDLANRVSPETASRRLFTGRQRGGGSTGTQSRQTTTSDNNNLSSKVARNAPALP